MGNSRLYPWPLFEILLPIWVYNAIVLVAFGKNTSIRNVAERLFRGAFRRQNGFLNPTNDPTMTQGIMISPDEIKLFCSRFEFDGTEIVQISSAIGWLISADLNNQRTPEHGEMQWVVLDLAYFRPIF